MGVGTSFTVGHYHQRCVGYVVDEVFVLSGAACLHAYPQCDITALLWDTQRESCPGGGHEVPLRYRDEGIWM